MSIKTEQIDIKGMYCSNCASRIEKVVGKMEGVSEIYVNLATEIGQVTFHQHKTDIAKIISRINQIGFEASPHQRTEKKSRLHEVRMLRRNFMISAVLTIPLAWGMLSHIKWFDFMYVPSILIHPLFQFIIAFPIQFIIGFTFYERAWKAIKNWSLNMDVLVVLSTSAAFFYSHYITFTLPQLTNPAEQVVLYYETSAFIITFILLGRHLEAKTKSKTTEALEKLYEVQMKVATIYKNNQEIVTKIDHLDPGDILLIKPGERVPIDGQVIEGHSLVDESLLTGESMPIEKKIGSEVYAGTINHHGVLMIEVMKKESETILSNIIKIVEEAQISKAPIQQIADKITGYFIPIVLLIASMTFFVWFYHIEPGYFGGALVKMIAVLIVACPCALGLATPTSMMVGSGRAAQVGVLFKEGKFMELLGRCDTVLLDKTGTITSGTPRVTNIYVDQMETKQFMEKIGAVERISEHPIAKAILKETKKIVPTLPMVTSSESIPSYGIKAVIEGEEVVIANASYYKKNRIKLPMKVVKLETSLKKQGKTVIIVYIGSRFAGVIATADEIKPMSLATVSKLKKMDYDVRLVTGDQEQSGIITAQKLKMNKVYTEYHPPEKAQLIKELQQEGKKVMMVGDGINDAPALAVADVGVAMGSGSDIAIEAGDVTIVNGDLDRLVDAIHISKKTMINIKQNFVWAFIYNIVMIPIAMFGILVPWLAGAAMAFSSISVVLNSLRLKRVHIS